MHTRRDFLRTAGPGAAAALLLAACSLDAGTADGESPSSRWGGELVDPGIPAPALPLTTMDGERTSVAQITSGRLALLSFGYTNCPDVCPVYLNTLARTVDSLKGVLDQVPLVLFVGVDIARDTPEQLRTYLGRIDDAFVGLTGTTEEIDAANRAVFNGPITIEEPDADGEYEVQHAARIFALSPDGLTHRTYPADVRQQQLRKDLIRLESGDYQ
jgi:protein SCO1